MNKKIKYYIIVSLGLYEYYYRPTYKMSSLR